MLKNILVALLVLASFASADIGFTTDDPLEIDNDESNYGVYLPNTGCRAMAEFQDGDYEGDVMVIDLHDSGSPSKDGEVSSWVWYNIWDSAEDEWHDEDFQESGQPSCFLGYTNWLPSDYSQLVNASIYSSNDGVIHLGVWRAQRFRTYSRYIDEGPGYAWIGFDEGDDSYWSASYVGNPELKRFGQVMQPSFYVNEYSGAIPPPTVVPTFVVNGHDCERKPIKAGFYVQTLTETDATYEGTWNDPVVITPQTFGNMGFSSVTGDGTGKLHLFWESSINTGLANTTWHSRWKVVRQNELYYTQVQNGQVGLINQLTDNYDTSDGEEFIGINIISSDVDTVGNVWALYEIVVAEPIQYEPLEHSIGIVKLSPAGSVLYGPEVLYTSTTSYNYFSPQIQIDEEGIAHCVYIRRHRSTTNKVLFYANFNTQLPIITLNDTTE
ncbi:MAG: hypothetical protein V3W44_01775, partial [Dehalococcoidales bacterium]